MIRRLARALMMVALGAVPLASAAGDARQPVGEVSTAETGVRCVGPAFDDTAAFQAAIDTGRTVYAPALGGECHVTRALVMRTPGQLLHGDGRARTKLVIQPGFAGKGVFLAETGEAGPVWRDFSISFVQPDTDERAGLTRYPPAFSVRETPRFEMDHLGCYAATVCVDMTGNSGGATLADLQMSAFGIGIDIDGSLDTVRIIDPHVWPFGLTPKQQTLFLDQGPDHATGVRVGRMDDLVIRGGLFFGGVGLEAIAGKTGPVLGTIADTDFDTSSGIVMADGNLQIAAVDFTLGVADAEAIRMSGGSMTIASALFFVGTAERKPVVSVSGGTLALSGSIFNTNPFDVTSIEESGHETTIALTGNQFQRTPNTPYTKPTLLFRDGRTTAIGNIASDKGTGAGAFMRIENDNPFNRMIGNVSPGWPPIAPSRRLGTYLFN